MLVSAPLGAMGSALDDDWLVEGVAYAEEWTPDVPWVEATVTDSVVYYFYNPYFVECSEIVNVLTNDAQEGAQERLQLDGEAVDKALTYLVGWHKGVAPFNLTLRSLVAKVERFFDCNWIHTWNSKRAKGFVVFDVSECALSYYQVQINDLRSRLGISSQVDEKEACPVALQPILRLYKYFIAGGHTAVFISDLPENNENRLWITNNLTANGYTAMHKLYLYPADCKDSFAEYRSKIRHELAKEDVVVATISNVSAYVQGDELGWCAVWVPSSLCPMFKGDADNAFYAKLHTSVATTSVAASQSSSSVATASQSAGSIGAVAAASISVSASQLSCSSSVAAQSRTMTTVSGKRPSS
jgi:hypothetical protein